MSIKSSNVEQRSCKPRMCSKKMTQESNKWCILFEGFRERSQALIKRRLFEGSMGFRGDSMMYFVQGDDC